MTDARNSIDKALQLLRSGDFAEARRLLTVASCHGGGESDLNLVWALYYLSTGDLGRGINHLRTEVRLHPGNLNARRVLNDTLGSVRRPLGPPTRTSEEGAIQIKLRHKLCQGELKQRIITRLRKRQNVQEVNIQRYESGAISSAYWFDYATALEWFASTAKPEHCLLIAAVAADALQIIQSCSPTSNLLLCPYDSEGPKKTDGASAFGISPVSFAEMCRSGTPHILAGKIDLLFVEAQTLAGNTSECLDAAYDFLAPGATLIISGIGLPSVSPIWSQFLLAHPEALFVEDRFAEGVAVVIKPPFDRIDRALNAAHRPRCADAPRKLRVLMPYSVKREYGRITLPEWIRESLEMYFADEVEVFACGPGNDIDISDSPNFYARVGELVNKLRIDVVFDVEGGAESLDFMFRRFPEGVSIPKIFWAIDTHQYLDLQREKAKYYDRVYSAQKNAVEALGANASWLPAGASLHEVDLQRERDISVGFVGNISSSHRYRAEIIARVQEAIPDFYVGNNLFLDEKAEVLSRMKIAVNVSLNNDVNFRVYETLATGALLLTDQIMGNGIDDLLIEGTHYVAFSDADDLIRKIQYYREHEQERIKIASAGQMLVNERYRHHTLLRRVISDMRTLVESSGRSRPPLPSIEETGTCWCGGRLHRTEHPLYAQCIECGTQVLTKRYSSEELKKFYSADGYWHQRQVQVFNFPPIEERANNDFYDRIPAWYQVLNRYLKSRTGLLEIGCAHGGFLHYCREHGIQSVVGVEVDEATCAFARQRFGLPHVVAGLFPEVTLPFKSFGAITGFDVIEHFLDPVAGLKAVAEHLSDDGICFFQTPCFRGEGPDWVQYKPAEHTFLYTEVAIRRLFERVGLEVVEILPGYFRDDMFVIGRRKTVSSGVSERRKVVFVRGDAIGDNVLATAMITPLARHYESRITVVCSDLAADLYESHPCVEEIITFNRDKILADSEYIRHLTERLEQLQPDIVLNSVYSRDIISDFLSIACNGKQSIAFRGDLVNIDAETRARHDRFYTQIIDSDAVAVPELGRHRSFLKALGVEFDSLEPTISLREADWQFADRFYKEKGLNPGETIILAAFTAFAQKDYPHWIQALSEFCSQSRMSIVVLGGAAERVRVDSSLRDQGLPVVNLCGETTLRQSAAIIGRARLVVGCDTSIPHIATALDVPNVVVLGGGHFGRFFPNSAATAIACRPLECFGCNWTCRFSSSHCVADVAPAVVAEAIRFSLAGRGSRPRIFFESEAPSGEARSFGIGARWKPLDRLLDTSGFELVAVRQISRSVAIEECLVALPGRSHSSLNDRPLV